MNLIVVILLLIAIYLGWQYLQTYQSMVKELKEMRIKCVGTASPSSLSSSASEGNTSIKNKLIYVLEQMKQKATP